MGVEKLEKKNDNNFWVENTESNNKTQTEKNKIEIVLSPGSGRAGKKIKKLSNSSWPMRWILWIPVCISARAWVFPYEFRIVCIQNTKRQQTR